MSFLLPEFIESALGDFWDNLTSPEFHKGYVNLQEISNRVRYVETPCVDPYQDDGIHMKHMGYFVEIYNEARSYHARLPSEIVDVKCFEWLTRSGTGINHAATKENPSPYVRVCVEDEEYMEIEKQSSDESVLLHEDFSHETDTHYYLFTNLKPLVKSSNKEGYTDADRKTDTN